MISQNTIAISEGAIMRDFDFLFLSVFCDFTKMCIISTLKVKNNVKVLFKFKGFYFLFHHYILDEPQKTVLTV